MNLLTAEHLSKSYTEKVLFEDVSLGIQEGDKIGLIGINGTGKSTLLKVLAGLEEADTGKVIRGNQVKVEFLPQNPVFDEKKTVLENVIFGKQPKKENWNMEGEARAMLLKMGIADPDSSPDILSGGQRKRAALVRALMGEADILILDEPTNHLDSEMSEWLEEYLRNMKAALLMITHDRYFLDQVTNRILELDGGKLYGYTGGYTKFLELKAQRAEMEQAAERKAAALYKKDLAWMQRGARARSTKQKAHIARFEELQNRERPKEETALEMGSVSSRLGRTVVEIEGLSKSYGDKHLFSDFDYTFVKQERIGIIGHNGCGKTTLLKILLGAEKPDAGSVTVGQTVKIGYFSQESGELDPNQRVIDSVKDIAEYVETSDGSISASKMLERFLFEGGIQYALIGKLSGGERRRLALLHVLMGAPNVLILDEPTNDLDIRTLSILEDYLDSFQGVVIAVSHDRYFLDRIANRIFAFEDGSIRQYEGGYSDYLARYREEHPDAGKGMPGKGMPGKVMPGKGKLTGGKSGQNGAGQTDGGGQGESGNAEAGNGTSGSSRDTWKDRSQKLKFSYQEQREYDSIEEDIGKLEEKLSKVEDEIAANASSYTKLADLTAEKEKLEEELSYKMERWVYLNDLEEKIREQRGG